MEHTQQILSGADIDGVMTNMASGAPLAGGAAKAPKSSAAQYNILAVVGTSQSVELGKFSGSSPSGAAAKAGRRVHKKTGDKQFDIIMRRVDPSITKRQMYKYHVSVEPMEQPTAVFTARVDEFKTADGDIQTNTDKRVRILPESSDPVYGHLSDDGKVIKGDGPGPAIHRADGKNTLTMVAAEIPEKVAGKPVQVTEFDVKAKRVVASDDEKDQYDVASKSKAKSKAKSSTASSSSKSTPRTRRTSGAESERHASA